MISRHLLIALADHHQKEAEIAAKVMAIDPKDDAGRLFFLTLLCQKIFLEALGQADRQNFYPILTST